jgi:prepilin signal peptidase PulO-like enzyme (type II secretory pathway)
MVFQMLVLASVLLLGWAAGLFARFQVEMFDEFAQVRRRRSWIPLFCAVYAMLLFKFKFLGANLSPDDYVRFVLMFGLHVILLIVSLQDIATMMANALLIRVATLVVIALACLNADSILLFSWRTPELAISPVPMDFWSGKALLYSSAATLWLVVFEVLDSDRALSYAGRRGVIGGVFAYALLLKPRRKPRWFWTFLGGLLAANVIVWFVGGSYWLGFYLAVMSAALSLTFLWLFAFIGSVWHKRQAMGSADMSLMMLVGAVCGPMGGVVSTLLGCLAALGLVLIGACGMKLALKTPNPLLPGLAIGSWFVSVTWPYIPVLIDNRVYGHW